MEPKILRWKNETGEEMPKESTRKQEKKKLHGLPEKVCFIVRFEPASLSL
jgi:hypothetical protein